MPRSGLPWRRSWSNPISRNLQCMAKHAAVEQPTRWPIAKVTAAGLGGLGGTLLLGVLDWADALDLPTFWDGLLATASAFVSGYVVKSRSSEL